MRLLPMLTCALLTCLGFMAGGIAVPPAAVAAPVSCAEIDLPVSVPTPREMVHGQLCMPAASASTTGASTTGASTTGAPRTVQLLIPGGTYNRVYWDFPYQPERYSYQHDMARHGYATFAVDQLGTGQSSKPPSAILPSSVEAASIHEVIGHLRAGRVSGVRFDRIILVGHSLGSGVATLEAATYHDVDGVILTSATHQQPAVGLTKIFTTSVHPVTQDPQFRKRKEGNDPGYITTKPGQRAPLAYSTTNANPRVIETDEATKDQASLAAIGTGEALGLLGPTSLDIDVPVLLAVGEKDIVFCGFLGRDCSSAEALRTGEALYFSPAAELSTHVLPDAGHAIALHNNSGEYREATRAWLRERFGTRDQQ
ncbi:MAG TPA: alpha/beta fold hydrolase [Pseudonocardiaceae bacterium]|nr:alpha/beta fold hydrolase [Pseudonocardiaceae bacterium]